MTNVMASIMPRSNIPGFANHALETLVRSPWSLILFFLFFVCLLTRVRTEIQSKQQSVSKAGPKDIVVVPYWIPWIGHAIPFVTRYQAFLADASKTVQDGVFHIVLGGQAHNVVIAPSVTKQVLLQRSTTSSTESICLVMERVFGEPGQLRLTPSMLDGELHHVVHRMNRDPFLSDSTRLIVKGLEEGIYNLISFSSHYIDQCSWERAAAVSVLNTGNTISAEADFFALVRHFSGDLAAKILMGHEFMENNPDVVSDVFTLDRAFFSLMTGWPRWIPGLGASYRARARLARGIAEYQEALYAISDDRDPGSKWDDMSDGSKVMKDRAKVWRDLGVNREVRAAGDLVLLWAMNANATQVIFWLLWYVYQDPAVHSAIMAEIAPYVKQHATKSDLPIQASPRLSIDVDGLRRSCPLFRATYLETLRLELATVSYPTVTQSFTVTESVEDATAFGRSQPQTYKFPRGSHICVPHNLHAMDERYFKNAKSFNPYRFFPDAKHEKGGLDKRTAQATSLSMGSLHVFGGGSTICKGRNFAEREVLAFSAAILMAWDVQPVDGTWKPLGRNLAPGALTPKSDVRVRITRKEIVT